MKKAWIIYRKEDAVRNEKYIRMYFEEGEKLGIAFELIYREKINIGCNRKGLTFDYEGKKKELPDFVINRVMDSILTKHLEGMGTNVFNNSLVCEICNDKAKTFQQVVSLGIPCIRTTFHKNSEMSELTVSKEQVIKAVDGHGGKQVFTGESAMEDIREGIGSSDFILQERVYGQGKDIRVYVIGKEIVAAVCRHSDSDFRANYSLGAKVSLHEMNEKQSRLVKKIINYFPFSMVGIDFLIDENGEWIFNEIEDVVGARMLYQCSSLNLVGKYLTYIIEQLERKVVENEV